MRGSRWVVPIVLSLAATGIVAVHSAASTPRSWAFLATAGGRARPATSGQVLWLRRYNGPGNNHDMATALGVSPDGSRVFVTGLSTGCPSYTCYDYATVAYDASTGKLLWVRRYNGPGNDDDNASALEVSPDGSRVFVTGKSTGSGTHYDYATLAYDASTGKLLWVRRYNGPGNDDDDAFALGVSPDGSRVFVTGESTGSSSYYDYATLAYDASTGIQLWVKRYNGPGNRDDSARALGVSPDGSSVYVTGLGRGSGSLYDYATVAYDASTGKLLWVRRYNGPGNGDDKAFALGVSPDGSRVFVTGDSSGSSSLDYATLAYDGSTGAQLWVRRYNGAGNGIDYAIALGVSPDGSRVFVTGASEGSSGYDYGTLAYDASIGNLLWVRRYNGPGKGYDYATALGVSPDGSRVFVTGESYGSGTAFDYATVACDASTGAQLWVSRYNGPNNGDDDAFALAVSPDGSRVLVTGGSEGSTGYFDYATLGLSVT